MKRFGKPAVVTPEIGLRAVLPGVVDREPAAARDVDRREVAVRRAKPVARISVSTGRSTPSATTPDFVTRSIGSVTSVEVRAVEGRVVVVREERPLAAPGMVGQQLLARSPGSRTTSIAARPIASSSSRRVSFEEARSPNRSSRRSRCGARRRATGSAARWLEHLLRVGLVLLGQAPSSPSAGSSRRGPRSSRSRGRAGSPIAALPITRDAPAGEIVVPAPLRGVEGRAGEGIEPVDRRVREVVEHAEAR